ncbi:MYXO-CTERM sorting domain-containing protein [Nannocystis sp. RBIL2]|uniref:MYXO-CTERM sorting domain-containing protein n=1 Tax=Nannocystis sp. RBIL2 TaxID=2996788 RepID=UPI00226EF547|nr:MYXO-CTERM sorting domain-containing protein [Nannocystis sp. RBIL2]MCY1066591.1 MYXO-CTERM sorting domain-containing protein [Nannocystis sp. RBIL2]
MKKTSRTWKRLGLQLGILAGAGLALVGGVEPSRAAPLCVEEGQCTFTKPVFLIALDYSTAMNEMFDADETRWQRAVAAVQAIVDGDNGYIQGTSMLALMRFGHDPDADQPGTTIAGDASGLVDGQKVDVPWYDVIDPDKTYFHCNGEAVKAALSAVPPPLAGAPAGIGAWTGGAMERAKALFAEVKADHPEEIGPKERRPALIVITQGVWSDQENTQVLQPPAADPAPVALDMWNNAAIPTFVLSVGDALGTAEAKGLALAGGTGQAVTETSLLGDALKAELQKIINQIEPPICAPAWPRIMFILDGSSSMLNVMGDSVHGAMGQTRWDLLRTGGIEQALGTSTPLLNGWSFATWSVVGAAVFGDDAPAEQKLLVDYAPCRAGVFHWALDPQTSCEAPGCVDPWGGPPIAWTFQTDEIEFPGPTTTVQSHVPRCDLDAQKPGACSGSGSFVHLGLELVQGHLAEARASCMAVDAPVICDAQTKFYNVLIMDGTYDSDDAAVQASLEQMVSDGVRTYVLGLGELAALPEAVEQLTMMAAWGSGGALDFFPAGDSQVELQAAFAAIFEHMFEEALQTPVDPCCSGLNCGGLDGGGETNEPDPLPDPSDSDGTSSTTGETSSTTEAPVTSTTSTTDASTTSAGPTTDTSTSTAPTTDTPTSGAPTTDGPTTDEPTTGGQPGTSAPGESGDEPTATDTDSGAPGGDAQEGCGCTSGADGEGVLASLVGVGLLGLGRRRRRAE